MRSFIGVEPETGPGLFLHMGNRLEALAEELGRTLSPPLSSPFAPETILVQSRGMERWISMTLARHSGVFANGSFPFPNAFVDDLCRRLFPRLPPPEESAFHPAVMALRLLSLLPEVVKRPGFEALGTYLADDVGKRKRMQVAVKIADLFDQYLVFRPDLIFRWESGAETHWQAELWRILTGGQAKADPPDLHRARLHRNLIAALGDPEAAVPDLPERVSVFGISYLPSFHLQVLTALADRIPVHLFFVNPCREYWADIAGRREVRRALKQYPRAAVDPAWDLHLEEGNRILAATGAQGRAFLHLISGENARVREHFTDPGADLLLRRVQSDILCLRNPSAAEPAPADGSIQIHSCHGPLREFEVLYDRLLAMFEEIPGLHPRDVLVMTPDIESAAPLIHAVFDAQSEEGGRIPYSVADRCVKKQNPIAEGLLRIMALSGGRLPAAEVLALLDLEPVRSRFGIAEADLALIERWVAESGIRWGQNARSRARLGLPAVSDNSWEAGIDRLLLGRAIPGEDLLFEGIAPYGHIEGGDARVLGRFLDFVEQLFDALDRLSGEHPPLGWCKTIDALIEAFFDRTEALEAAFGVVQEKVSQLARAAERAQCREPIGCAVIQDWLERELDRTPAGTGFIAGGVTFGAMVPMRSIPFKVICMVGMNSGAFPREDRPLGFDLMARHPRPGDRSRRDDDKYLFLEALVSARERLYISYTGQSVQDNTALPPSVLVSELIDAIQGGYGVSTEALVTRHPLHAFSDAYFQAGSDLFSYSTENLQAAEVLRSERSNPPFFGVDIPLDGEEAERWRTPTLDTLCEFFANPSRFLLRHRLSVRLETETAAAESSEPFSLDGLQAFLLGQELVEDMLAGKAPGDRFALARARGRLPHGGPGEVDFRRISAEARTFVGDLHRLDIGPALAPQPFRLDLSAQGICGRLEYLHPAGICIPRFAGMRSVDLLAGWIRHLVLCAVGTAEAPPNTLLVFRDGAVRFGPVAESRTLLEDLLGRFRTGLSRPLHFFPLTSETYARVRRTGAAKGEALSRARLKWRTDFGRSEGDDPYYRWCFRDLNPLDDAFCETAEAVWTPLLARIEPLLL